ncbi:MAG: hypothetical protein ABL929_02910 [Ferruginibacter sp.]|nr:hypothetical protein [Ferruginibacter sp.]
MKKIILLFVTIISFQLVHAQAYDGMVDYNKKSQYAVIAEYKFPQETVEKILKTKLEDLGLKVKNSKGFMVVNNSTINNISTTPMDYSFKVEKKSKREKETMLIYMVMNINDSSFTATNSAAAKIFLNELAPSIDGLNTDNLIKDQMEVLAKAQKKYKNLQEDQASMEKKIRNLQDDLSKNSREQTEQQNEVKRQQDILDVIKAKKK